MATWDLTQTRHHVLLCNGSSCNRNGAEEVTVAIRNAISEAGLDDQIHTTRTRCNGRCQDACVVIVYPEGIWYRNVTPEDAPSLLEQHLQRGEPIEPLLSHRFVQQSFAREKDAVPGISKSEKNRK